MKKNYIQLFAALLAVAFIAGVSIFNSCKKEEAIKNVTESKWQEKIEYMDIPCVDFSRISKQGNLAKGEVMLQFESWEHYASVIDAMLDFSYNYIDTRINEILQDNPNIDEDALSEIIHNEGIYQFMPLYSFCNVLQFDNNAFQPLRTEEIQRMQQPQTEENNPFDEMGLGYIQSALHNSNGDVLIGNEVFNPMVEMSGSLTCTFNKDREYWLNYNYDGKRREMRNFLRSYTNYTFGKTSVYWINNQNKRIVWCCRIGVTLSGKRMKVCNNTTSNTIPISGSSSVFASVVERYCWYTNTYPNYLFLSNSNALVFSIHTAPGKTYQLGI